MLSMKTYACIIRISVQEKITPSCKQREIILNVGLMSPGILKIYRKLYLMNTVLITLIELCPLDQWKSAEVLISIELSKVL